MTIELLDPTTSRDSTARRLASRPPSLEGLSLGVLDNGKPNADRLLAAVVGIMSAQEAMGEVTTVRKPAIGRLAPEPMRRALTDQADVVVTGVGDCSGCATCTVQDTLDLETDGVPTAMLVTDEFLALARRHADLAGATDQRFVVVEHPLGSRTSEQLEELAHASAATVIAWLTGAKVPLGGVARAGSPQAVSTAQQTSEGSVTCLC